MELPNTYQEWSQEDKDRARHLLAKASGCLTVLLHLHPYLSNVETLVDDIDTALGIKPVALEVAIIRAIGEKQ